MNLANQLTLLRVGLALAMFTALMQGGSGWHMAAFGLFLAAILTDWVDGYVARRTGTISAFGKVADPIADKILVIGALIALLHDRELSIPEWGVFLIIIRELAIGGVRILASSRGKVPAAQAWGKLKMGVQSVSVLLILAIQVLNERDSRVPRWLLRLPYLLTILCVIVAWDSAYRYFRESRRLLEKSWG
jgi:CDP-diacylglycerol--glycerol-3-phosphate 3-phosphatidyltransferase